jgi:hypothetical protein
MHWQWNLVDIEGLQYNYDAATDNGHNIRKLVDAKTLASSTWNTEALPLTHEFETSQHQLSPSRYKDGRTRQILHCAFYSHCSRTQQNHIKNKTDHWLPFKSWLQKGTKNSLTLESWDPKQGSLFKNWTRSFWWEGFRPTTCMNWKRTTTALD